MANCPRFEFFVGASRIISIPNRFSHSHGEMQLKDNIRAEMIKLLPRLQRFGYALTGSMDQGDDLVQETCVRALTRIDQWQPGTRLDSWMFRIAHNLWLDNCRASKVRGHVVDITDMYELSDVDGREIVESRQTLGLVMKGIEGLPADQKILVALVCIDGLSYKETANIVDVPIGTVMSRLARARRTLRDLVDLDSDVLATAKIASALKSES